MPRQTRGCGHLSDVLVSFLSVRNPEVELLDHMVVLFFNFLRNIHTVFHSAFDIFNGWGGNQKKNNIS